ncbi:MAG: hypothetical protein Q7R49_02260 [Candidatus Daviesbacteria bacterium]|nr:hypothetical protein [Candidatus Daviesbacteria bacterium]
MILESLNQTNIGSLNLEEPPKGPELLFDPKRDIKEDNWQLIVAFLKELGDFGILGVLNRYQAASLLKLFSADKLITLDGIDNGWLDVKFQLVKSKARLSVADNFLGMVNVASFRAAKILYPEKFTEVGLKEEDYPGFERSVRKQIKDNNAANPFIYSIVRDLKILFPNHEFDFDWEGLINEHPQVKYGVSAASAGSLARLLAGLRIVDENRFKKIAVTGLMWRNFHQHLRNQTLIEEEFTEMAANMAIIAAEEVVLTEKEFYLIPAKPKPSFTKETPPIPEMRKF